jgi:hypothetical protein
MHRTAQVTRLTAVTSLNSASFVELTSDTDARRAASSGFGPEMLDEFDRRGTIRAADLSIEVRAVFQTQPRERWRQAAAQGRATVRAAFLTPYEGGTQE